MPYSSHSRQRTVLRIQQPSYHRAVWSQVMLRKKSSSRATESRFLLAVHQSSSLFWFHFSPGAVGTWFPVELSSWGNTHSWFYSTFLVALHSGGCLSLLLLVLYISAPSKMPCSFLTGLLRPLPVPQGPWSHISLDFVTDLPLSEGNHYTLVFQYGTFCCPAEVATRKVDNGGAFVSSFQLHRLPQDTVSDQGPQFAPQVFEKVLQTAQGVGKPSGQKE